MFDFAATVYGQIRPRAAYYLPILPLAAAIGSLVLVYQASRVPLLYTSEAKIVVSGKINLPETANAYKEELADFLGTQIAILGSGELAAQARQKLHLDHPESAGYASVQAHSVVGTTIIAVDAVGSDPAYTADFLRSTLDQFLNFRKNRRIQTTDAALAQIREEIPRTEEQLKRDEDALFKFKQQHNMGYWEREAADAGQLLSQLKGRQANLQMQLQMALAMQQKSITRDSQGRLMSLSAFDGSQKHGAAEADPASPDIDPLREQLIKLQVQRDQLLATFQPGHPRVQKLDEEIRAQSRLIQLLTVETARSFAQKVASLQIELGVITGAIADCEHKALESAHAAAEYERLQANLNLSRDVHARLVSGLQNVDVSREVDLDMVQILQEPTQAVALPKNFSENAIRGAFFGLIFGFLLFAGAQRLDQRAFSAEEIAGAAGAPILSEIPHIPEFADSSYHPVESGQPPLMMEAMSSLASSLKLSTENGGSQKVIFCSSATPDEGKSTVALHLALYLERSGLKTLLIDADLRRGRLGETLGLEPSLVGVADLVESRLSSWSGGVHSVGTTKLDILPRGNPRANTVNLLARWLNRDLFAQLRSSYDVIIIDSSPLVLVADSVHFLSYVDHVLLIGRIKSTQLKLLKKTAATIRKHARGNLRLIVNEMKLAVRPYGYGYAHEEWTATVPIAEANREPAA